MKKSVILIVIVLVTVAGWAGATYVVGGKVENSYSGLLEQFSQMGPMSIDLQSYERGWFSSTAQTVFELTVPVQPAPGEAAEPEETVKTLRLVLESSVQHGPLLAGAAPGLALIETRLLSLSPGNEELEQLVSKIPQLKESLAVTRIDFSGNLTEQLKIPAFASRIDETDFSWGGLTLNSAYSPGNKTLAADFKLPSLEINAAQGQLTWAGMQGNFDLVEALPLVYVGTTDIEIGGLDMNFVPVNQDGPKSLHLKGLKVASTSRCTGKLVDVNQTMEFGGVTVAGETYGPGVCIIEAKNLDGEVLGSFQEQVRELYRTTPDVNPDALVARLIPLYSQLLLQLLDKSPEINVSKFNFATPKGTIDARLQVKFDGTQGVVMEHPAALLQGLDASADLAIHENLVRLMLASTVKDQLNAARDQGQLPDSFGDEEIDRLAEQQASAQIDAVLAQNFMVRDGELIIAQATFKRGELLVNGHSLPLFQ
jgi:uncharacterized protein YdgA (DUF945 family)